MDFISSDDKRYTKHAFLINLVKSVDFSTTEMFERKNFKRYQIYICKSLPQLIYKYNK